MKLVYKILFAIIIPIAIISVIFIFFIQSMLYSEVESRFVNSIENTTDDYASLINLKLESLSELVNFSAKKLEDSQDFTKEQVITMINETVGFDSIIFGAAVFFDTTYTGKLSKSFYYAYRDSNNAISNISFDHNDKQYREYFNQNFTWWTRPKATGESMWTSPYFDEGAGNLLMITYTKPFFIDGSYCGIVTIDILLENIKQLLLINEKRIEGDFDPDLYIINALDSLIIYTERAGIPGLHALGPSPDEIIYDMKTKLTIFDLVLNNKSGSDVVTADDGHSYFVFHSKVESCDWIIIDILSVSEAQSAVYESVSRIIIFIMIFLSALVVIIFVTSRLITNPLSKLSNLSVEISDGNYNKEININRNDEIGTLAKNFNIMIDKVVERENSLKDANKQLLVLDEAKNEFLKLISHEIRTPLNGIVGSAHFLNDIIEDPELREFLEMLKESVERLDKFSKKALEITEMQAVGRDAEKTTVSTSEILDDVINELKPDLDKKQLIISTSYCDNYNLFCVKEYFKKSIIEVLDNAIRFSHNNSEIEVKTLIEDNKFKVKISDSGEVISPDKIEKIVQPFGLGNEHYDKHTGLGLAYIQKFLEIHDASIEIVSNIEKTEVSLVFDKISNQNEN